MRFEAVFAFVTFPKHVPKPQLAHPSIPNPKKQNAKIGHAALQRWFWQVLDTAVSWIGVHQQRLKSSVGIRDAERLSK